MQLRIVGAKASVYVQFLKY